jgi:hypothetical protein
MTGFVLIYLFTSVTALVVAWLKGGHPERLGVVFWLVGWILSLPLNDLRIGDLRWAVALVDIAAFAAFLWLALQHERWWPLGLCACMILTVVVHAAALLIPEMTALGESSAQLGLGMLSVLLLLTGALERWLAGEPPARSIADRSLRQRAT